MKSAVDPAGKGKHNELALKLDPEATKKLSQSGVKVGRKDDHRRREGQEQHLLEMEDFFNSVRTGAPVSCDWRQGLGAASPPSARTRRWRRRSGSRLCFGLC